MRIQHVVRGLIAAALLCLSAHAFAAIRLVSVVSSGLSSPVFVGNAGDGSNRLFIVEKPGIIRVLQPSAGITTIPPSGPTPTVFLDIRTKVRSTGLEQGLLGLAFHPQYATNGRFFVFYTRIGDGALVIAEYKVSTDPNVADPAETVILTIPHPTHANHNGGMLAFGQDGYLYIGAGDGGDADDPPDNAQNENVLLGKILRIDINPPAGSGVPYLSPTTNPFYGATPGRDEIFALGMRNPWRFSFDRLTGQQWVGDVGQDLWEEVDTPIAAGGNYGWRVYEGFHCTGNDPMLCIPANYTSPIFEYSHTGGRCSVTGGYVYRGALGTFPVGTYIYGDYCTGEIFTWDGNTQTMLLDTTMNISSFGEDEQGELYVVNLGGTVSKLAPVWPVTFTSVPNDLACTYSIWPALVTFHSGSGVSSVAVTAGAGCSWTAESHAPWIRIVSGSSGRGSGAVRYSVAPYTGRPRGRTGTITIAGQNVTVTQSR